ncbi:cytochrome c oxidase subunit 3 family protein [Sorangium sp. So ce1099]|uniref:cytochrome c oxidase subunit 3 family protein n=1 Tax=Sorangium sp. So ce1099 TaxID=3133331 RepID=UPI003F624AEA
MTESQPPRIEPQPQPLAPARLVMQFEDLEKQTHAAHFGMWIFLASEVLLFGGLFGLYAAYRAMFGAEFAAGIAHNSAAIGTANTAILLTSSLLVALSVYAVRLDRPVRAGRLLLGAIALGAAFLTLKGIEYTEHFHEGIFPGAAYRFGELPQAGARVFFTLYYVTTGLHAIHVTAGLAVLGWLAWGCFRRRYGAGNETHVELGGLYWHLVDVVWIFLWPMLYLMHR